MTFDHLWSMLYNHGATNTKRIECAALWERLTPTQQTQLVTTISTKIREDKFVHYDPLRAMQENIPKTPEPQPTNWNGRTLNPRVEYVIAKWNGAYGTYTKEDALAFGMPIANN